MPNFVESGLDPDWKLLHKCTIRTRIWTELMEKKCIIYFIKKVFFLIFCNLFGLEFLISKQVWTVVGPGLSFENSRLDLDRKI